MAEIPDGRSLLKRWRRIAPHDREAIVAALPEERQEQFRALLADAEAELATGQQYLAYSPWLGQLVEACVEPGRAGDLPLTPATRAALAKAHEATVPAGEPAAFSTGLAMRLRRRAADWMAQL